MSPLIWPTPFKHFDHVRLFLVSLCVILSLVVAGIFLFLYYRTNDLLLKRVREQAITYADLISHTKMWNFYYGGVYVEKKGGIESNSYLKGLGINPDVSVAGGRTFTVRNHAIMIEEISRQIEQQDGVKFRITSLKPIAPSNTPDQFEKKALAAFEEGTKEWFQTIRSGGKPPVFRYLLPLYVDATCLECHRTQGYRIGSVIGAISITIPVGTLIREARANKLLITLGAVITIGLLVGISYFLTWRLVIELDEAQKSLKKQATTDELTGLVNRRQIMKRLGEEFQRADRLDDPLCLILLDIDHFKEINDTYGHPFGDNVLRHVANRMQETIRTYDILGRIGGEEFLIIAPGSTVEDAVVLAERVRHTISSTVIREDRHEVVVTASAGVSVMAEDDKNFEGLLKRVDRALYRAKEEGRDRVVTLVTADEPRQ